MVDPEAAGAAEQRARRADRKHETQVGAADRHIADVQKIIGLLPYWLALTPTATWLPTRQWR
jgi:hypothetical protein